MGRMFRAGILAGVVLIGLPASSSAQDECADYCNSPETFCSTDACFDGRLRTTCTAYNTHYGASPQICQWPSPGQGQVRYPNDGINWSSVPNGSAAGNCYGNCGAGCSDNVNPCGGPTQYWELTYASGPQYGPIYSWQCVGTSFYRITHMGHTAIGRWTYHGYVKPGCWLHDGTCPELTFLGCLWFAGCGSPGWADEWSYDQLMYAFDYEVGWDYLGEHPSCNPPGGGVE